MKTLARWGASLALLAAAAYLLDWPSLVASAARLTPWVFSIAVLLACVVFIPLLVRWQLLAGGEGGWSRCAGRYLYANLLNAVSPGSLGGDIYRFFAFRSGERSDATLIAVLVRERLLGLASMLIGLLAGVVAMEFATASPGRWLGRILGLAAAAGLAVLLISPRMLGRLPIPGSWRDPLQVALSAASSRQDAVLLGWSLAALALWVATVQFVAVRLGIQIPWPQLLAIVTAVELLRIIPVTVQGIGVREAAFASLFGVFGYPQEDGFVLGAAAYLALSVALVATGALGALMLADRRARGDELP